MKAVYIAGPMRDRPEFNFPAFFDAAWRLESQGYTVYNPAQHDIECNVNVIGLTGLAAELTNFDIRKAMKWDCAAICECDAIYMLHGWEDSKGACVEIALAELLELEILYQEEVKL